MKPDIKASIKVADIEATIILAAMCHNFKCLFADIEAQLIDAKDNPSTCINVVFYVQKVNQYFT